MRKIFDLLLLGKISDYAENISKLETALLPFGHIAAGILLNDQNRYTLNRQLNICTFFINNVMVAQVNILNNLCRLPDTLFKLSDTDTAIVTKLVDCIQHSK